MGFTIEDMLVISKEKYRMEIIAGRNGWSNSISFLMMLEDTTIIRNFSGKELAVTTGLGFQNEEEQLKLVEELISRNSSGLIFNTGGYVDALPDSVIRLCDENDFPLLTVPWDVWLADMIKDLSIRIFLQGSTDEQISNALIKAIEDPEAVDSARKELLPYFDTDGVFQVFVIYNEELDKMDTVERKRLAYRLQLYLTNLSHNGHFFYYDASFILIMNAVEEETAKQLILDFQRRSARKMPESKVVVGCSTRVMDVSRISIAYQRAKAAARMAVASGKDIVYFDEMGPYRLMYSVKDPMLLAEMSTQVLAPLIEYDEAHRSDYVKTLELYLKYDESIQAVADAMFAHRNTIIYRMRNIKKLLNSELKTADEKLPYELALMILKMNLSA